MDDHKREDAADRAPRPDAHQMEKPIEKAGKQDAPNYEDKTDGGRALKPDGVSSANDE